MKKTTLFVIAAFSISTATFAQNNNSLNLKKGQKYLAETTVTTKSTTEAQGQSMETNIDAVTSYNIEVKDVTNDNYNFTNTVSKIKMNMSMMGQEMNFDSEKKEDLAGPMGSALKEFINNPKNVVVDKSGKLISQQTDTSGSANPATLQFEAVGFGTQLAFEPLPAKVKAGDKWVRKTDNNGISQTTNYTVKSISGDLATLSLDGTIITDMKMEQQGMEMTNKTSGKFTGEEIVNTKTGVIQSSNTTADASGNIEVMGQQLPTSSKVTTTTTVKML